MELRRCLDARGQMAPVIRANDTHSLAGIFAQASLPEELEMVGGTWGVLTRLARCPSMKRQMGQRTR